MVERVDSCGLPSDLHTSIATCTHMCTHTNCEFLNECLDTISTTALRSSLQQQSGIGGSRHGGVNRTAAPSMCSQLRPWWRSWVQSGETNLITPICYSLTTWHVTFCTQPHVEEQFTMPPSVEFSPPVTREMPMAASSACGPLRLQRVRNSTCILKGCCCMRKTGELSTPTAPLQLRGGGAYNLGVAEPQAKSPGEQELMTLCFQPGV